MILKLQFEICLEIGHDFKLLWKNIFIKKLETNYPWSPTTRLALTVAGQNGYPRRKYRWYIIDLSWLLALVAILGWPDLRRSLTVPVGW